MNRFFTLARRLSQGLPEVGVTPSDVVHRENKWKLIRYRSPERKYRTPVLLVPSLINRHYVLDLMPGKSFAEYMVKQGHDVFCIDWGTPGSEDRHLSFDDFADGYLGRAVRLASRVAEADGTHVLGYCLGGTLATVHAAARPDRVSSLFALAAPVDFHDDGLLSTWIRQPNFDVNSLVGNLGNMPWQLMQATFHMLKPTLNLAKAVHFLDRMGDERFLESFLAMETWANDNVSFPGGAYRDYVNALYHENALMRGTLRVNGVPAKLENITCPTFVLSFSDDHIVPGDSASVLVERVGAKDVTHMHLPGGHVGAVVSSAAAKHLWPKISEWWAAHDQEVPRRSLPRRAKSRYRPRARRGSPRTPLSVAG